AGRSSFHSLQLNCIEYDRRMFVIQSLLPLTVGKTPSPHSLLTTAQNFEVRLIVAWQSEAHDRALISLDNNNKRCRVATSIVVLYRSMFADHCPAVVFFSYFVRTFAKLAINSIHLLLA